MPFCGCNAQMLQGLANFAQGLYKQALKLSEDQGLSIEDAMEKEIKEMNVFLAALDDRYDELRKKRSVDAAMVELAEWTETHIAGTPSTSA